MGCELRTRLIFAWFLTYTVALSAITPATSKTTCSQLVACCMRVWGEVRFQSNVGDKNLWHKDACACLVRLRCIQRNVQDRQHDGLSRENVEYVVHLIDRISEECDDAYLASFWAELRSVMLEV